jgi:hypothetical protein
MDPIVTNDEQVIHMRDTVRDLISHLDPAFTIHDFRMVEGPTHTNLIFDVAVPFSCRYTDVEIVRQIKEKVSAIPGGKYFAVIQIDREYC